MSVEKCKILWIDDELSPGYSIWEIYEIAKENYKDRLCIDVVLNVVDFEAKITKNRYDAVIMDVNITEDYVDGEPAPMIGRICKLCSEQINNYNLQLYAFTGALSLYDKKRIGELKIQLESSFKRDPVSGMFYWDKSSGLKIFDEILKNYDERIYAGFEYLLDIFSNGWINNSFKTEFLDPIMEYYHKNDYDSAHGNHMRNITEQILIRINNEFKIETNLKEGDLGRFRQIAEGIKNKKLDDSKAVHGPLLHMISIANERSHFALDPEERKLYFKSDFSTFFIVTKWFYKLMIKSGIEIENTSSDIKTNQRPRIHGTQRTGKVYPTYKENNKTYCNLKVYIHKQCQNLDKVLITGIKFSPYHETPQAVCCEPEE